MYMYILKVSQAVKVLDLSVHTPIHLCVPVEKLLCLRSDGNTIVLCNRCPPWYFWEVNFPGTRALAVLKKLASSEDLT